MTRISLPVSFLAIALGATPCTAAPTCSTVPVHGCAASASSQFRAAKPETSDGNRLSWSWKGTATKAQFGDPVAGTGYQLCVYEDGALLGGPLLLDQGSWEPRIDGFRYKAAKTADDGVTKLELREGSGDAKISLRASGAGLAAPPLPSVPGSIVTVQLVKDGASGPDCWEGAYRSDTSKQTESKFLAKEKGGSQVLSAYFGLDDALPPTVEFLCPGGTGKDGMPVVFRQEISATGREAADFRVTTTNGLARTPSCVTERPAGEQNENRTILLVGDFGDAVTDPPASVELVDSLRTESDLDLRGWRVPVTPLSSGPFLVYAEIVLGAERELGAPDSFLVGGGCPVAGTLQVVKVTWAGGVRSLSGAELGDAERLRYRVVLEDGSIVAPFALADLNDQDNNHDLCLDDARTPIRVEMEAGTVMDPGDDPNPATSVAVTRP